MGGQERTVALLAALGLMVIIAEGWAGNFRDWVRASVGASNSIPGGGTTTPPTSQAVGNTSLGGTTATGTTAHPTF